MATNLRSISTNIGRGVGRGTVYQDRLDEELFFRNTYPPELSVDVIRHVWLSFVGENGIAVIFENGCQRFALTVVVEDSTRMGWKECQCLVDALRMAERGRTMTEDKFDENLSGQFRQAYGKTEGPRLEHNILLGYVFPVQESPHNFSEDIVKMTGISVDSDGDVILQSEAFGGQKYTVCVELRTKWPDHNLPSKKQALYKLDCRVLIRLMTILETGNKLDRVLFLGYMAELRLEFNFVVVDRFESGRHIAANILASRVKCQEPLPQPLADALHFKREQEGQAFLRSSPNQPPLKRQKSLSDELDPDDEAVPTCPYPGCSYTSRLKESGQATLFAGKYNGGEFKDKDVAIKVFDEEDNMQVYRRELSLLLKMSSHPNVVEVIDFFEHPVPCVVLELIPGSDMMDFLENNGAMAVTDARRVALALADGIRHLHRNGAVHRDLKSSNILLTESEAPVIIDFGLGATIDRIVKPKGGRNDEGKLRHSLSGTFVDMTAQASDDVLGSILWLAPEMIKSHQWGKFTDTWYVFRFSKGVWSYLMVGLFTNASKIHFGLHLALGREMLSGVRPYVNDGDGDGSDSSMAIFGRIANGETPNMERVKHADKDLLDLMKACWNENPKKRPTMKHVVDILSGRDPAIMFSRADRNRDSVLDFYEFVAFIKIYGKDKIHPSMIYDVYMTLCTLATGNGEGINLAAFQQFWSQLDVFGLEKTLVMCRRSNLNLDCIVEGVSRSLQ